ncbi:MAG: hypothetical protein M3N13_03415, partial [Candidatus Eremiobacteraeota bacterium]|nr:hypothetical protein [Candidatus Eremiobacteraeota bacterium]
AMAAAFLMLRPFHAMLAATVLVVVSVLTLGNVLLNAGYWIDPVLPLLGIQLHELVAIVERRLHPEETHA